MGDEYRISSNKRPWCLLILELLRAALIRGRCLLQCGYPKVRRLFGARRLLEEIRYEESIDRQKCFKPSFYPGGLLEILIMLNFYHAASRILTDPLFKSNSR